MKIESEQQKKKEKMMKNFCNPKNWKLNEFHVWEFLE